MTTVAPSSWGAKYGGSLARTRPGVALPADAPEFTGSLPAVDAADASSLLHHSSPLMAVAVIVGLTFGLLAFSAGGSVRVGKATAHASGGVGKTGAGKSG